MNIIRKKICVVLGPTFVKTTKRTSKLSAMYFDIPNRNFMSNCKISRITLGNLRNIQIHSTPSRSFAARGSTRRKNKNQQTEPERKPKYVKPHEAGEYSVKVEPVLKLENGYYLAYYHRQKNYTMFLLYLKYIIPIVTLLYLIKKNPFYKSYPIMLPAMVVVLLFIVFK